MITWLTAITLIVLACLAISAILRVPGLIWVAFAIGAVFLLSGCVSVAHVID